MTRRTASSMIGSFSLRWTKPRVTISGVPTTEPVCLSTVTTIMNMPSVASDAPVAQDDLADVADRQAVDEDVARGDRRAAPGAAVGEQLDRRAVLDDEDVVRQDPGLDRQAAVLDLHPELAVDRDEVLGLGQPEHELELLLAGVAGDVRSLDRVVVDVGAGLEQVVDRPRDVFLVAGDRARADDDRVAGLDLDEAVVAVGHARQAGHGLALGAGRGDDELRVRMVLDLVLGHDPRRVVRQVAEVRGDLEVLLHRPADDRDVAVHVLRCVEDLLDARDVARERGDDDPALERLHDLAERLADGPLGRRVAGVLRAGRVGQEAGDALRAEARQDREVGQLAVDRRVVELEVAGVDDGPDRRLAGRCPSRPGWSGRRGTG